MTNSKDVYFILARLAEAYRKDLTDKQVDAYVTPLAEYPRLILIQAAQWLLQNSKWFPRVSEFVQAAKLHEGQYYFPGSDVGRIDEATCWLMYRKQYIHTDQLTEKDVDWIYTEAGIKRVEEARYPGIHKGMIIFG